MSCRSWWSRTRFLEGVGKACRTDIILNSAYAESKCDRSELYDKEYSVLAGPSPA